MIKNKLLITVVIIWFLLCLIAFFYLLRYQNQGDLTDLSLKSWPTISRIKFEKKSYNLVIFIHPKCTCSNASIEELNRLLPQIRKKLKSTIVLMNNRDDKSWFNTNLVKNIQNNPYFVTFIDRDEREIKLFGVKNSGHVLVFTPKGKLIYSGGITAARGHSGDNLGSQSILKAIAKSQVSKIKNPVFGCPLMSKS